MSNYIRINKNVTDTDDFTLLPLTVQALFFHIAMHTDKNGDCFNPHMIARSLGVNEAALDMLKEHGLLADTDGGDDVIKGVNVLGAMEGK